MPRSHPSHPSESPAPAGALVYQIPHPETIHTVLLYHRTVVWLSWRPRVLIVRLSQIFHLDARGARAIATLGQLTRSRRTQLILSEVHPPVRRRLFEGGALDEIGPANVTASWEEAVARARATLARR